MTVNALGSFIKRYVLERQLTINDLAKSMKVPHTTIARWVRGDTEPSLKQLVKLSIATNMDLCDLVYMVAPDAPRRDDDLITARDLAERISRLPEDRRDFIDTILMGIAVKNSNKKPESE